MRVLLADGSLDLPDVVAEEVAEVRIPTEESPGWRPPTVDEVLTVLETRNVAKRRLLGYTPVEKHPGPGGSMKHSTGSGQKSHGGDDPALAEAPGSSSPADQLPDLPEGQRWVYANNLPRVLDKVEEMNRKARRYGLEPFTVRLTGRDHTAPSPDGGLLVWWAVEVSGEPPKIPGYKVVAVISHMDEGTLDGSEVAVKANPVTGEGYVNFARRIDEDAPPLPQRFIDGPPACDACKRSIHRNKTFVLWSETDKKFVQLGSEDVKAYTGYGDPTRLAQYADLREGIFGEFDGEGERRTVALTTENMMNRAAQVILAEGYVSGRAARAAKLDRGEHLTTTAERISTPWAGDEADRYPETEATRKMAAETLAWYRDLDTSEFPTIEYGPGARGESPESVAGIYQALEDGHRITINLPDDPTRAARLQAIANKAYDWASGRNPDGISSYEEKLLNSFAREADQARFIGELKEILGRDYIPLSAAGIASASYTMRSIWEQRAARIAQVAETLESSEWIGEPRMKKGERVTDKDGRGMWNRVTGHEATIEGVGTPKETAWGTQFPFWLRDGDGHLLYLSTTSPPEVSLPVEVIASDPRNVRTAEAAVAYREKEIAEATAYNEQYAAEIARNIEIAGGEPGVDLTDAQRQTLLDSPERMITVLSHEDGETVSTRVIPYADYAAAVEVARAKQEEWHAGLDRAMAEAGSPSGYTERRAVEDTYAAVVGRRPSGSPVVGGHRVTNPTPILPRPVPKSFTVEQVLADGESFGIRSTRPLRVGDRIRFDFTPKAGDENDKWGGHWTKGDGQKVTSIERVTIHELLGWTDEQISKQASRAVTVLTALVKEDQR